MRSIRKSPEPPASLTKFNTVHHTDWSDIHTKGNQHVYEDCRTRCVEDQNGLCGYTEIPLHSSRGSDLDPKTHIDHYIKVDIDPGLTFSWTNMVAAIHDSRFGADWKDNNKDDKVTVKDYDKAKKCYTNLYNPIADNLDGVFSYATDGSIVGKNNDDIKAKETIKKFNLNETSLKDIRRQCMDAVRSYIDGELSKDEILKFMKGGGLVSVIEFELSHHRYENR